ncbi:putative p53 and DNA damage-regulated protein [Helianthus annuus]|nr:putative p53 and DNA damage-regulated protein [Helianthus annuus]
MFDRLKLDHTMKQFQEKLIKIKTGAKNLLLASHELVEIDRIRSGNRDALTTLKKLMPLVKEVFATCGNHESKEKSWMMFSGTDIFARVPFHATHIILEKDYDVKKLQDYVKEKSFLISEQGVLADKICSGVLKSMITLQDKPKGVFSTIVDLFWIIYVKHKMVFIIINI